MKPKIEICKKCPHYSLGFGPLYPKLDWQYYIVKLSCDMNRSYFGYYVMDPPNSGAGKTFGYIAQNGNFYMDKKAEVPWNCEFKLEQIYKRGYNKKKI